MGATNHTKNLNLPQFVGTDKPSWLGDVNNAFADIDKGFGDLKVQTSSVISGQIKALEDLTTLHSDAILKLDSDVSVNTASINSMSIDLQVLDADIETVDKREQSHFKTLQDNIDLNNKSVSEIEKDNIYIKKNMDKIEADVVKVSVSIASNNVRVQNLSDKVDTFDGRITTLETDTANTQAQVNVLTNRADNADARLDALEQEDITIKGNIASLDNRVTPLEALPNRVATVEQQATDNAADIVNIKNVNDGQTTAITALQTKTNNITDGVFVPFSFGKDTSGNYGFILPNGQVQPFFTDSEWQSLVDDISANMGDIADLQAKVVGIVAGKTLPYSLAIAPGGAYGYIKNGEQGVTAFLTESDVNQIVNLQPIEADVQSLQTDMSIQQAKTANITTGVTVARNVENYAGNPRLQTGNGSLTLSVQDPNAYSLRVGGPNSDKNLVLPFSFGIDSNGNYGYYKAGADTVTPFKKVIPSNIKYVTLATANYPSGPFGAYCVEISQFDYSNTFLIFVTLNNQSPEHILTNWAMHDVLFTPYTGLDIVLPEVDTTKYVRVCSLASMGLSNENDRRIVALYRIVGNSVYYIHGLVYAKENNGTPTLLGII